VQWHDVTSVGFNINNDTQHGPRGHYVSILVHKIIKELILVLVSSRVGCNIGGLLLNVLAYADDLVAYLHSSILARFTVSH
jgi:hypothetical protein